MMRTRSVHSEAGPGISVLTASAWRGFWGLMIYGHAGAALSAWTDCLAAPAGLGGSAALRAVVLSAAVLFFGLKLLDVAWLRIQRGRRPLVAAIAIVAVLHVNVVQRAVGGDAEYSPLQFGAVLVLGAAVESELILRGCRQWGASRTPARLRRCSRRWPAAERHAWAVAVRALFSLYTPPCRTPRAPPLPA
ncbi:MAG: hypothetical protein HY763_15240 [Planctomycetes bacterium]|nr:hypothetical protein [Planctomycetota bacterium]